ncbi:LysR family transcriptional regulator [Lactobacillus jensenii]|jgi:transcriptional regulator|uniref:LysR family transcriptional regulator n=2 Tax=Lactobacillus jensenii TaxID=109790 RepID=A0A5N1IHG7_LACJE|nr:LysR family transcriptional regulator [Lactobacillus jensenii]EEQ68150.2 transcriptional regulator, LysR family [Lactobacillus jensenii 1153]ERJ42771.1 LysR family transcriptional regulator [Lactobacillus jensenii MD IIE-70(2)]APT14945.1 LysR family transcriptional regulator [Lactobacillus jensenii]EEQ24465.1 transcriptional regulator, LysR family [Lactobacillus jensenii 269-3]EEX27652.1 transcriptional regulator, LysR family [Lactobacillus jensenii SJ-7A-US]
MDTRVLRYFLTVAQTGNITEAAKKLHITQPTLSRQLQKLEQDLNQTLLDRKQKGHLVLTDAGNLLARKAEILLQLWSDTVDEVQNSNDEILGILKIGIVESRCSILVEKVIRDMQKLYPKLQFDFYSAYSDDLKSALDMMRIDCAILLEPVESKKYFQKKISIYERWGIIVGKRHPWAKRKEISPSELNETQLIISRREIVNQDLESSLGTSLNSENIKGYINLSSNINWLLETGEYATLGIEGVLKVRPNPNLVFIPLTIQKKTAHVLVWRKNSRPSAAIQAFSDMLEEKIKQV